MQQDQHRQTDDADAAGRGEQQTAQGGGQQGTCESEQMGSLQWGWSARTDGLLVVGLVRANRGGWVRANRWAPQKVGRYWVGIGLRAHEPLKDSLRFNDLRASKASELRTGCRAVNLAIQRGAPSRHAEAFLGRPFVITGFGLRPPITPFTAFAGAPCRTFNSAWKALGSVRS